jgi:hypothetical protein
MHHPDPTLPETQRRTGFVKTRQRSFCRRFDFIPATAGLTNAGAFHLSIRPALALLPAPLANGTDDRSRWDCPDRFSLR